MFGLTGLRLVEIGVALVLTVAALLLVGVTVWAAEGARISVADAWARPTVGQGRITAAYMTIANKGETDDVLHSARTPMAKSAELHQTTMTEGGMMQMRKVEGGLPIGAGGVLELTPGGTHLMVLGLENALSEGDELKLTLEFEKAGSVGVVVPVSATAPKGAGASPDHSHH